MAFDTSKLADYINQRSNSLIYMSEGGTHLKDIFEVQVGHGDTAIHIERNDIGLQLGSCSFTPNGTTTLSNRVIKTAPIKANIEWCKDDLYKTWLAWETQWGAKKTTFPFETLILNDLSDKINAELDKLLLNGGLVDGIQQVIGNDPNAHTIAPSGSVYNDLYAMLDLIPMDMEMGDWVVIMSIDKYKQLVKECNYNNVYRWGSTNKKYIPNTNVEIVPMEAMKGNDDIYMLNRNEVKIISTDSPLYVWNTGDTFRATYKNVVGINYAFSENVIKCGGQQEWYTYDTDNWDVPTNPYKGIKIVLERGEENTYYTDNVVFGRNEKEIITDLD